MSVVKNYILVISLICWGSQRELVFQKPHNLHHKSPAPVIIWFKARHEPVVDTYGAGIAYPLRTPEFTLIFMVFILLQLSFQSIVCVLCLFHFVGLPLVWHEVSVCPFFNFRALFYWTILIILTFSTVKISNTMH